MCKSPPAEGAVRGASARSWRGKELISPFNLRPVLVGLSARTTFLPCAGGSSRAVPGSETTMPRGQGQTALPAPNCVTPVDVCERWKHSEEIGDNSQPGQRGWAEFLTNNSNCT